MRKLILSLALLLSLTLTLSPFASPATSQLTGTLRSPSGNLFNGTLKFFLPFSGTVDTNCTGISCAILPTVVTVPVTNGTPATTGRLTRNGDISPAGTYYKVYAYDTSGQWLSASNIVIPVGVATFDLGAALQTTITTNNISYINPANLTGNNTWSGTNTFNGPVIFNSTVTGINFPCSATAAANTVCGNNTGGIAAPSYVKVSYAMTDGTTIAPIASPVFTGNPTAPTPAPGDSSSSIATTAWFQSQVGSGLILASGTFNSCNLVLNGGEWNCAATITWGPTLPISNPKVVCQLGPPAPGGSYPVPAGYQANIYIGTRSATQFNYTINDDHSGSNGAGYSMDCIATR